MFKVIVKQNLRTKSDLVKKKKKTICTRVHKNGMNKTCSQKEMMRIDWKWYRRIWIDSLNYTRELIKKATTLLPTFITWFTIEFWLNFPWSLFVLPVRLLLDLLLLELFPRDTQLLLFVESGDSAGLYWVERGFKIADDGFVSAVEFDVTEVALLLPPAL